VTRLVPCRFAHFIAAMPAFGASAYPQLYAPRQSWPRALTGYRSRLAVSSVVSLVTAVLWPARQAASIADDWSAGTDPGDRHIMDFAAGARGGAGRRRFDDAQPLGDEDRLIGSCAGGPRASGHAAMQTCTEGLLPLKRSPSIFRWGAPGSADLSPALGDHTDKDLGSAAGKAMRRGVWVDVAAGKPP
jgi:hypothetical protein